MVLSGTLREFILADVFQLLTQQKITGKLLLANGRSEGFVIFQNGLVVAAQKDDEKLISKLFNYLVTIKKQKPSRMRELFTSFEGNMCGLTTEIINRNYISKQDLNIFSESLTIDIACSLFLWSSGTYRFNSMPAVDAFIPAGISVPVENIVMEAMRRSDEWKRMLQSISEQSIFVRSQKDAGDSSREIDPITDPDGYILTRIDGTSPVKDFVSGLCLSEYKIYESIYNLLEAKSITTLSDRISQSVQAALHKKERERTSSSFSVIYSILAAIGIILIIMFMALIVFKKVLVSDASSNAYQSEIALPSSLAAEKLSIAKIYYRALNGSEPEDLSSLKEFRLVTDQDLNFHKISIKDKQKK
ncbi:MAG: DUF4388 domain-containing protein [Fibrobacter sp.]|nr:DUF4388 domain-containing protein [Fibrobacter sp.]